MLTIGLTWKWCALSPRNVQRIWGNARKFQKQNLAIQWLIPVNPSGKVPAPSCTSMYTLSKNVVPRKKHHELIDWNLQVGRAWSAIELLYFINHHKPKIRAFLGGHSPLLCFVANTRKIHDQGPNFWTAKRDPLFTLQLCTRPFFVYFKP